METQRSFFLQVEKSLTGRAWLDRLDERQKRLAGAIADRHEVSDILSRVLAARNVDAEQVEAYLDPKLRDLLPDPATLTDMDAATARLADAIDRQEHIALFGDYDVDGASSTALMRLYLRHFGLDPEAYIPDRVFEGYGPNPDAIDKLADAGATLLVTLDCGTTSIEAIAHARRRNLDVLVIDHHQVGGELPLTDALVNPNRGDDLSGLTYLSAAGVTFMVLVGLNRELRKRGQANLPDLMQMLDLVALATVCDVVPLVGLNRAIVHRGLEIIRAGGNPGITALGLAARLSGPASTYSLGYMIGPRINAGGRIGDASLGMQLLTATDESEITRIAARLDELNSERQAIEAQAVEEAIAVAEREIGDGEGPLVLVLESEHWHPGVVGLVAARLKERFDRPAFAIAMRRDGTGSGSGRSVSGVDLGHAVHLAVGQGLVEKGGGHAMAAGITIRQEQISRFKAFISEHLQEQVRAARDKAAVQIDAALTARAASTDFVHSMQQAGPFGAGNPSPVFAFPAHRIKGASIVGVGGHVRCTLLSPDGARLGAIAFRAASSPLGEKLLTLGDMEALHVCGNLSLNHWQGRETAQLRIEDAALPG
ncbi:MAG: single-stranded-DNA-specific exonuclease RecJ [Hyphomicrobiaceae bacterium]|nr:single-stranded-DNA-specific exonuclease RecJ [Hyphomicrobiaceae bacterium]MCC0024511.1 single-stranded-DNA-specific exonuclease RecJ [Hyphomicrobiaceae bacterium]